MNKVYITLLAVLCFIIGKAQNPVSHPDMQWDLKTGYSDEFNSESLDSKWNTDVRDWGTWAWEPKNAYVRDNNLVLRMQQEETIRKVAGVDKQFYFTSGIAQIPQTITYGYFETRIKASDKGQGTCPAFWLYSVGQYPAEEEGDVRYCEIDVIEIFQIPNTYQRLEMNLHTRIIENGVLTWKRPGQGDTELCHNSWDAPWDPRDEYHTYGVESRVDSIFWYVDGELRGKKKNYYWHLPMHVTVSMGLRTPYEKYIDGVRTVMEYPSSNPEPGFPTEMFCDYVRVWEAPAQIIVDNSKYENIDFGIDEGINFECYFNAGSGYKVQEDLTVKLVEKDASGYIVNIVSTSNANVIAKTAGKVSITIPLTGVPLSEDLTEGHYYALVPEFTSSKDINVTVSASEEIGSVKVVESDVSIADEIALQDVSVYPNPANSFININGVSAPVYKVSITNIQGKVMYKNDKIIDRDVRVPVADFSNGLYFVIIQTGAAKRVLKFVKE